MKRFFLLFVILLISFTCWIPNITHAQDASTWMPDANLRTAVRKNLGLADDAALTQANILNLTKLRAADKGISDLTGIEHATNLTVARLAGNSISDLSSISGLTQLTSLRLQRNQVSDISALSNLTNLTQLLLWDNEISNVKPLENLTNLVELKLDGNPITDATPLASLPNLIDIDITIPDPPQEDPPPQNDPPPPETPADVDPPEVSVSVPSDVQNGAFDVTITFTEAVSDFEQSDVSLTGTATATITAWSSNTDNTTYTATITPTTSGTVTLSIATGVATDAASNPNTAATTQTINVDINAPSVSISVPSEDQTSAFDATITFTEAVSDFVQSDVSLSGTATATITSWSANTENTVYTATITPTTSGTVEISVAANAATDTAGNNNTAATTQTVTVFVSQQQLNVDTTPPDVSIVVPSGTQYEAFEVSFKFTEPVSGFEKSDVSRTGSTALWFLTALNTTDDITYTATINVFSNGKVVLSIAADVASDAADNPNTAAVSQTVSIDVSARVEIPDDNLVSAVRTTLGLADAVPLTEAAMLRLTTLSASAQEIADLTGLGYATKLKTLDLSNNQIEDVSPLVGLENLVELKLSGNSITNAHLLSSLTTTDIDIPIPDPPQTDVAEGVTSP